MMLKRWCESQTATSSPDPTWKGTPRDHRFQRYRPVPALPSPRHRQPKNERMTRPAGSLSLPVDTDESPFVVSQKPFKRRCPIRKNLCNLTNGDPAGLHFSEGTAGDHSDPLSRPFLRD